MTYIYFSLPIAPHRRNAKYEATHEDLRKSEAVDGKCAPNDRRECTATAETASVKEGESKLHGIASRPRCPQGGVIAHRRVGSRESGSLVFDTETSQRGNGVPPSCPSTPSLERRPPWHMRCWP